MLKKATFRKGGVHPYDSKSLSRDKAIEILPVGNELVVALSQHLGRPAIALKQKGDHVAKGERIGAADGFISADVHSPVSGKIKEIKDVLLSTGATSSAYVIIPDEVQEDVGYTRQEWENLTKDEILSQISESGIVGLGGATFPTQVKMNVPRGLHADYLLINGVECEPYLTCDYRNMLQRPDDLLEGIMIANRAVGADNVVLGIEENKMDLVQLLDEKVSEKNLPIMIQPLKMKYPQGDEKQLVKACTKREIQSGKLPIDSGTVIINASTAIAIFDAIVMHKPLYERVVTVTGEGINNPKNLLVPIGTRISDLIQYCGGTKDECNRIVTGGPMMGFSFYDENTPVTKGTSSVLCLITRPRVQYPCISCGKCVDACPMGLMPTKMNRFIMHSRYEDAKEIGLMDCKECGCCSFVCPSHIDLVQSFRLGKRMLRRSK